MLGVVEGMQSFLMASNRTTKLRVVGTVDVRGVDGVGEVCRKEGRVLDICGGSMLRRAAATQTNI